MYHRYGYQLDQAQRITPRAEILAADAQRGRQAAAVTRRARRLASGIRRPWPSGRRQGRGMARSRAFTRTETGKRV
jgi:hypothetical protein